MRLPLPQFNTHDRSPDHIAEVIETSTTEFVAQCLEPEELSFAVMPPFGSWVKAIDEESGNQIYAVVYHATTSPIDSVHRARALGLSLQELRSQQPQIFAMLKTEFRAAIVGFQMPVAAYHRSQNGSQNGSRTSGSSRSQSRTSTRTSARQTTDAQSGSEQGQDYAPEISHSMQMELTATGTIYQHLPPRPPQVHQAVYVCSADDVVRFSEQFDFLRTLLQLTSAPVDALVAATLRDIYQLRKADRAWLVEVGRSLSVLLKDDYDRLRTILSQIYV